VSDAILITAEPGWPDPSCLRVVLGVFGRPKSALFFPGSTTFAGLDGAEQVWSYHYATISEHPMHWADTATNGDGQIWPADGDIG
jgi:hypothetical protein